MGTANNTATERAKLLEAASGDLSKTQALLRNCRRMTDPVDPESVQIERTVLMALWSLDSAIDHLQFCNDLLGGA